MDDMGIEYACFIVFHGKFMVIVMTWEHDDTGKYVRSLLSIWR